jgi:hypothetical protein
MNAPSAPLPKWRLSRLDSRHHALRSDDAIMAQLSLFQFETDAIERLIAQANRAAELEAIVRALAEWDAKYSKRTIYPATMKEAVEGRLDEICAQALGALKCPPTP